MKQIIIVQTNVQCSSIHAALAKAPMKFITRVFEESPNFIGAIEAKEYKKIIQEWVDGDQNTTVLGTTASLLDYQMQAELCGCPTVVSKTNGEDHILVIGPWDDEVLDDLTDGLSVL